MYIIQLLTGIIFTLLAGTGGYLFYDRQNNAFLAAAGLFLLIALSCYLLGWGSIRRKRNPQIEPEDGEFDDEYYDENGEYEDGEYIEGDEYTEYEDGEYIEGDEYVGYENGEYIEGDEYVEYEDGEYIEGEYEDDEYYNYPEDGSEEWIEGEYEEYPEYDEEASENPDLENMDFSPFYLAYIEDLLPIEQDIIHSNTSAALDDQPIEELSIGQLENAIERTQVALNALTRLRMFCETRGTGGPEYYEEAIERYESDPYFLTVDMLNAQIDDLRKIYDDYQAKIASGEIVIEKDPFEEFQIEEASESLPDTEEISAEDTEESEENTDSLPPEEDGEIVEEDSWMEEFLSDEPSYANSLLMEQSEEEKEAEAAEVAKEPEITESAAAESTGKPTIILPAAAITKALKESEAPADETTEVLEKKTIVMSAAAIAEAMEESTAEPEIPTDEIAEESEELYDDDAQEAFEEETGINAEEADEDSSPFEYLSLDESDIAGRILRVISSNEGIQQTDLVHSFEPPLRKQVKKALHELLKNGEVEKKRIGLSSGLFCAEADEEIEE